MTGEERSVLAGELALGLLDGEERGAALRRLLSDRDFAREVEWWRDRLADLFAESGDVAPGAGVEARIMAALPRDAAERVAADAERGTARSLRLWRAVAGAATLAAAAMLAALVLRPDPAPPPAPRAPVFAPAPLLAVLTPTDDAAPLAAAVDRRTGVITLAGTLTVPAGRVAQLWTIGTDGAPRSLGLLPDGSPRLAVASDQRGRLSPTIVLAISIEPTGGSTTGAPTGPVIVTGPLTTI